MKTLIRNHLLIILIGDVGKLCEINYVIANIFEESQDYHKAVYYFSKSVSTAKQAGNFAHEAKVKTEICSSLSHLKANAYFCFSD